MPKYTSCPCSCIVCRLPKTSKGIHSHYLIVHTEEGKEQNRKNRLAGGLLGSTIVKQEAIKVQNRYLSSPNNCKQCNIQLSYSQRHNKFCSLSCSATFHNENRKGVALSPEIKQKISKSVKHANENKPSYSKISFCCICEKVIPHKIVKTCSSECKSKLLSKNMIERIKKYKRSNYRRDKQSYLEKSFEDWLSTNDISLIYKAEYTFRNHITKKWYFVDFYFPEINLIVELDGKQHESFKHKEKDRLRDEYLKTYLNIDVFRISYNEYKLGSKIEKLLELFQYSKLHL